ncbi:MAG TPA: hypothetical protein VFK56_20940 [Mycobacterium sp.]|nr:hypothetical protein [Mycobacterium sp.]
MAKPENAVDHHETPAIPWSDGTSHGGPDLPDEPLHAADRSQPLNLDRSPELRIRPFSLLDVPHLVRLPGVLRLDLPDALVYPRAGLVDLPAALPLLRRERPTFVATADGQRVGFIRYSIRPPDGRWVVSSLAASTGVYSPEPVWEALLAHGVRAAGLRGVRRLFARVPAGHPLIESMWQSGWVSYTRETLFRAERLSPITRSQRDLRLQEPADTWAIHQLYAASAPRQIQEIEAFTSQNWHMTDSRRGRRGTRQTGWILEENGQVAAYARYTRGARAGMIDAVVPPGAEARLGSLLDGVISVPRQGSARPVYFALRAYMLDMRDELATRGFTEIGEQELLIRYTTATARTPAMDPVHFPVELRPAMPRRVPTFLEGQPTDGTI